jgi:3-methyl-2-oxobutanoate hydroxymethyltransferase
VVGDTAEEAAQLYRDALALQDAGAWGVILQNVPGPVAREITARTQLVTVGAVGTRRCAGYLVQTHDLMGWPQHIQPLFSEPYAQFFERAVAALNRHCAEVQALQFPTRQHTFEIGAQEFRAFMKQIGEG